VSILFLVQLLRGDNVITLIQFALILTVASIPVAMPAVLSVTMAVGALVLSKKKVIVSRLEAIEEAAGLDILCSDKTGTLTQNKLTLGDSVLFKAKDDQELILYASLSSETDTNDAIDLTVVSGMKDKKLFSSFSLKKYIPFDPIRKRTEAILTDTNGKELNTTKGATQVIMDLCKVKGKDLEKANEEVEKFAAKGYKTLGVARKDAGGDWQFLGILTLFDPPREDSAATIAMAREKASWLKWLPVIMLP